MPNKMLLYLDRVTTVQSPRVAWCVPGEATSIEPALTSSIIDQCSLNAPLFWGVRVPRR